jgi:hypothetical protein
MKNRSLAGFQLHLIALSMISTAALAQSATAPASFYKAFQDPNHLAQAEFVAQTADGGYVLTGTDSSNTESLLVTRLDASGKPAWKKAYAVSGSLSSWSIAGLFIQETSAGLVVAAEVTPPLPLLGVNTVFLGLDSSGNLLWQTSTFENSIPLSAEPTPDGGYLLGADDFDVSGSGFQDEPLVIKLDTKGNVIWKKNLALYPTSIHATVDGGAVVAGNATCTTVCNAEIVKLDSSGKIDWEKQYTMSASTLYIINSARQTSDGGYVTAGIFGGVVTGQPLLTWLDSTGKLLKQQGYSSPLCSNLGAVDAMPSADGGYLMPVGGCSSTGSSIVKLDQSAAIQWQNAFAYPSTSLTLFMTMFAPTADGGLVSSGFLYGSSATPDATVIKTNSKGRLGRCSGISVSSPKLHAISTPSIVMGDIDIGISDSTVSEMQVQLSTTSGSLTTTNGCRL